MAKTVTLRFKADRPFRHAQDDAQALRVCLPAAPVEPGNRGQHQTTQRAVFGFMAIPYRGVALFLQNGRKAPGRLYGRSSASQQRLLSFSKQHAAAEAALSYQPCVAHKASSFDQ
jgi:hypothetical protein